MFFLYLYDYGQMISRRITSTEPWLQFTGGLLQSYSTWHTNTVVWRSRPCGHDKRRTGTRREQARSDLCMASPILLCERLPYCRSRWPQEVNRGGGGLRFTMGMRRRNEHKRVLLKQEQEKEHRRIVEVWMKERKRGEKSYYIVANQDLYIYKF